MEQKDQTETLRPTYVQTKVFLDISQQQYILDLLYQI